MGHLQGELLRIAPGKLLLDVGGVGYELHIPLSTYYELQGRTAGARVALHVHTHVRDDAIQLFGFSTELERRLFEKLIAVSGIGPRLAQTVLSGMSPGDLIAALRAADLRRLSSVPGIGKKTAERMIVELRDKVADLAAETGAARPAAAADGDLLSALLGLGYKQAAAERAAAEVAREHPEAELPELLKLSLKRLSRV